MDLHPDLIDPLTEFASSGAEYLIVGGWAVGVHSEPRYTKDLDILVGGSALRGAPRIWTTSGCSRGSEAVADHAAVNAPPCAA
jgi:hypothetical protein